MVKYNKGGNYYMDLIYLIIFFVFGLFMGSFYTVVGLRLPRGENFISNRSYK